MSSGKYFRALFLILAIKNTLTLYAKYDDWIEEYIKLRKLREAGFDNFDLTSIQEMTDKNLKSLDADTIHRRRRSVDLDQWHIGFTAFEESYKMTMVHAESVLHPSAKIQTINKNTITEWKGKHPDCFLTGELHSHNGSVSAAFCKELTGIVTTDNHELHFEVLPQHIRRGNTMLPNGHTTLVARKNRDVSKLVSLRLENDVFEADETISTTKGKRSKRAVPSTTFTIELAVYVDEDYLKNYLLVQSTSDRVSSMIMKYNGVAFEWGRSDVLGYNVTLSIKLMEFFDTNPSWYNISTKLGVQLGAICQGTASGLPFDHVHVHTGVANPELGGIAYQSKVCDANYRCGVSTDGISGYVTTAHEIGHNMGMIHDADAGCQSPDVGLMGGSGVGWSSCSVNAMDTMLQTGNHGCLWVDNILDSQMDPVDIKTVNINPGFPGQMKTNDEICESMFGTGFSYREFPQLLPTTCNIYSCVNLNIGNKYGQMFKVTASISGSYCEDNKICFKGSCQPWSAAQLTNPEVRAGGWSAWGSWTTCSRTCGRGISFRKRRCDNPTPRNHAPCDGDEHDALGCKTTPCPGDSPNGSQLRIQRATETCAYLIDNAIINGSLYKPEGAIYSYGHGHCEVACAPVTGYTVPSFTRYGLIEHGTPCPGTLDTADANNYPRRPGFYWACLEGYCKKFDCANTLNSAVYDGCGVCGGDNSSCTVVSGSYTDDLSQWGRGEWFTIPVGAYNIELFSDGNNGYYVEIHSKEGKAIIAPGGSGSARIFTTGDNPITYGGTLWHYSFTTQIMHAKGPLDTPVVVKVFNYQKNSNTQGIYSLYSAPLNLGSCTGTCANGGTWVQDMCACNCQTRFSGTLCDSQCPSNTPLCKNGATLNPTSCECTCNEKQFGSLCDCKFPYTGEYCNTCKHYSCQNGGTFSAATCRCSCPLGYGGLQCETPCANVDDSDLCQIQESTGNCTSDNVNMEQNCMVACNLCQPSSCNSTEFTCVSDTVCIHLSMFCDGTPHCNDGSDEHCAAFGNAGIMVFGSYTVIFHSVGLLLSIFVFLE